MDIHAFIALPHRFRWGGLGGDDCFTFVASWIADQTGKDPAEMYRGAYASYDGAHSLIDAHGGELSFADHLLSSVGMMRITDAVTGDVGLVRALVGDSLADVSETIVGAIKYGPLWASISPGGVICRKTEAVAMWSFR